MRPAPRVPDRPRPDRPALVRRGAVLLALLLLATAGAAGTAAALLRPPAPVTGGAGQWLDVDGVRLRLDRTVAEQAVAHAAPGSTSGASTTGADQPAPGTRRVSVEVTLQSVSRQIDHAPADFRLGVPGTSGAAPLRWRMAEGELQPGRSVSGRLTYQVPVDAERLVLTWGDARVTVEAAAEPAPGHGAGKPSGGHGAGASGGHSGAPGNPDGTQPGGGSPAETPDHHAGDDAVAPHDD